MHLSYLINFRSNIFLLYSYSFFSFLSKIYNKNKFDQYFILIGDYLVLKLVMLLLIYTLHSFTNYWSEQNVNISMYLFLFGWQRGSEIDVVKKYTKRFHKFACIYYSHKTISNIVRSLTNRSRKTIFFNIGP